MPIVNPAHKSPTKVILILPFKANSVTITTAPRNATFTTATNFNDFICKQTTLIEYTGRFYSISLGLLVEHT